MTALSPRLSAVLEALPLRDDSRVIEIGCGPGALARAMAGRVVAGRVLAIDRSARAVDRARTGGAEQIAAGRMEVRQSAIEAFALSPGEPPYDLAVACRVGALDGRHPDAAAAALAAVRAALVPGGLLYLDGGDPLRTLRP